MTGESLYAIGFATHPKTKSLVVIGWQSIAGACTEADAIARLKRLGATWGNIRVEASDGVSYNVGRQWGEAPA